MSRSSYTVKFNLKVTAEAEQMNDLVAVQLLDINEQQNREWKKNKTYQKTS